MHISCYFAAVAAATVIVVHDAVALAGYAVADDDGRILLVNAKLPPPNVQCVSLPDAYYSSNVWYELTNYKWKIVILSLRCGGAVGTDECAKQQ